MKKFLATIICLAVTTPCFAMGGHRDFRNQPHYRHQPAPHYKVVKVYNNNNGYHRGYDNGYYEGYHRGAASGTTRTLAAVAGVAGVAAIFSAIID